MYLGGLSVLLVFENDEAALGVLGNEVPAKVAVEKEDGELEERDVEASGDSSSCQLKNVHGKKVVEVAELEVPNGEVLGDGGNHEGSSSGSEKRNGRYMPLRKNKYKLGRAHRRKKGVQVSDHNRPKKRVRGEMEEDPFNLNNILGLGAVIAEENQSNPEDGLFGPKAGVSLNLNVRAESEGSLDTNGVEVNMVEIGGGDYSEIQRDLSNPSLAKEVEATIRFGESVGARLTSHSEMVLNSCTEEVKTGPSVTGAAWGKVNSTAKAITEGGFESMYKQIFAPSDPNEKLKRTFACYLSTTTGPVAGTIYLSTARVAFCSDRPCLPVKKPGATTRW
ncbi:hypothetical protein L1987_72508 [Smallanthus sonchifolius]|uniref:Uncharacterized protein n=1 Tax=Smallanthus sonchifolius TaxID=185202 RepID=A0ACB9AZU3_9ASTR|nr:hypothetical protein L1987_72508 [Smallanthus sonchifolius]